jgi:hypothetical protein
LQKQIDSGRNLNFRNKSLTVLLQGQVGTNGLLLLQVRQALLHVVEPSADGMQTALGILVPAAKAAPDSVQVLLAMATAFVRGRQVPKARNLLKRIQVMSLKGM